MALLFLYAHFLGVGALAGAVTLETVMMERIRRATQTAEILEALIAGKLVPVLFPAATLLLVASGVALMAAEGRDWRTPWLLAAFALVVAGALAGKLVIAGRLGALAAAAFAGDRATIAADVDALRRDPVLRGAGVFSTVNACALLFLMTAKPDAAGAALTVFATVLSGIGAAAATPMLATRARAVR